MALSATAGISMAARLKGEFTFQICVEGEFTPLYDQAGLMLLQDDAHWLKAGIEYNDAQPMIGSVLTNPRSDWATGIFTGNPRRFWLRLTRLADCLRLQYSTDGKGVAAAAPRPVPAQRALLYRGDVLHPRAAGAGGAIL